MFEFLQRHFRVEDIEARSELEQLSGQGWEIKAAVNSGGTIIIYFQKKGSGRV